MAEPTPLLAPVKPAQVAPRLWRDGRFVTDRWLTIADDAPQPLGPVLVSLVRWRRERVQLNETGAEVGVRLLAGETLDAGLDDLDRLRVVALPFPKFSDGRAYSTARRLREVGFAAEIRAAGDVLLDQIPLMLRAGFDAFEIVDAATVRALEAGAVPAIRRVYQAPRGAVASPRFAGRVSPATA